MGAEGYNDPTGVTKRPPVPQTVFPADASAPAPDPAPAEGDEFDSLQGDDLDKAVEAAGIDASTGGSKRDGSLTADEKRDALRNRG